MNLVITITIVEVIAAIGGFSAAVWAIFNWLLKPLKGSLDDMCASITKLSDQLNESKIDMAKNYRTKTDCEYIHQNCREIHLMGDK